MLWIGLSDEEPTVLDPRPAKVSMYRSKRRIDVALGLVLALLATPLIAVLAAVSAVRFRAWPFFVQGRVGWNNHDFPIIKVRSLPRTAPPCADKEELASIRVDRWGTFIRRQHLDELPQLWQVVKGDMSLVGPRPMIHSIVDRMPGEHRDQRHSVPPGVTGLWQISEDGERLVLEAAHWDERYLELASLKLDTWILWTTAKQTLGLTRPLSPADMPKWVPIATSATGESTRATG